MKKVSLIFILLIGFGFISNAQNVTIGTQVWMTKNLDVSTFRNGDIIPEAKTDEEWELFGESKIPAWCYYENDPVFGEVYGKLYNWHAVSDPRGLAPEGFHIPTDEEQKKLLDYVGSDALIKMKSTSGWAFDLSGTNVTGFSALPGGGRRVPGGTFDGIGGYGAWWSSTEFGGATCSCAWELILGLAPAWDASDGIAAPVAGITGQRGKEGGSSVRCLKD